MFIRPIIPVILALLSFHFAPAQQITLRDELHSLYAVASLPANVDAVAGQQSTYDNDRRKQWIE